MLIWIDLDSVNVNTRSAVSSLLQSISVVAMYCCQCFLATSRSLTSVLSCDTSHITFLFPKPYISSADHVFFSFHTLNLTHLPYIKQMLLNYLYSSAAIRNLLQKA